MEEGRAADQAVVIRRTVRAPRERVFQAWTTPGELKRWWAASPAHTPADAEVDLRVGGAYRLGMTAPSGTTYVVAGVFREITPPRRLVYTWRWIDPERSSYEALVTVEFLAAPGATEIVVRHEALPDASTRKAHTEGWTGCLAALTQLLETYSSGGAR